MRTATTARRLAIRIGFAVVGGLIASLAFPRHSLWPVIFLSVAMLLESVRNANTKAAFGVGFLGGLFFYLAQIPWIGVYLGPLPWIALSVLEALIFAFGAVAINLVWKRMDHLQFKSWRATLTAAAIASIWVAREWFSSTFPYGGFPWARLALSQSESFLGRWVWFAGSPWLSFLIAFISAVGLIAILNQIKRQRDRRAELISVTLALVAIALPFVLPISAAAEAGTMNVAAVQGNAKAGLLANGARGSILKNHLDASASLNSGSGLDLVIWPENAADLSPLVDASSAREISNFVNNQVKVPLIFGVITARGEEIYNSSVIWKPGLGPTDFYDKKRPVPFGEYVPDRWLWRTFAPDLIDLIPRGYSFGEREGIFEIGDSTPKKLGILICFEIAVDDLSRQLVDEGAQVLIAQTNNADFGYSDESLQQLAIAKLRAIETGRSLINISTVGTSAIFLPDGTELDRLPSYTAAVMQERIPLRSSKTPAMWLGSGFELAINFAALVQIFFAVSFRIKNRRPKP